MHRAYHHPAAKGTSLRFEGGRGEGGGGVSESVKKGKFVTKIFLSVNTE